MNKSRTMVTLARAAVSRIRANGTVWVVLGVMMTLALPRRTEAQVSMRGGAGGAVPSGTISEFVDSGPSLETGASFWLSRRVAVRTTAGVDFLFGDIDVRGWRLLTGIEVATLPRDRAWSLALFALGGANLYGKETVVMPTGSSAGSALSSSQTVTELDSAPAVAGGAELIHRIQNGTSVFLSLTYITSFQDDGFGRATAVPVLVGLDFSL